MLDINSILNEIDSFLVHFNVNYDFYIANLDNLYHYANNNISSINMSTGSFKTYTMLVIPSNTAYDPITMTNIYKTHFENVIFLRESLNYDIDQVADRFDLIDNNSHNHDQGVHNTITRFKNMHDYNVARYNSSITYHRVVVKNKFIR